ncbi:MAG TPA: pitrilysin family protein [Thermoanaerobaculia bacterium]|nr:pitrilysin family protein [Thermoanaerobaculia bacterium]
MNRRMISILASAVAFALAAGSLLAEQKTPPPPAAARAIQWPKITEKKLENGLTVVLVPLPSVPKIAADLTFLTGRGTDAREHPGLAQLAARVLPEGTATRSSKAIQEELRSIGGSLASSTDADRTTLSSSALSEFSPKLLALLSDVAQHASFPKDEVDLAKSAMQQEVEENHANPDFLADERIEKAIFGSHSYGFVAADPKAIGAITREQLRQFAAARYRPNGAHLIIVGDLEPESMLAEVRKAFGSWARGQLPADAPPPSMKREKRQIYFIDRPGSVQSTILIGNAAPARKSPDYLTLRTANVIYGGAFYSRLTRNIRESKGYTYSPFSTGDLRRLGGAFFAGASVRNEVTGPTILEMLYELDRMRVTAVTPEELESAKNYSIGAMAVELESQSGLAVRIDTIYTFGLPRDFLETFRAKINAITAADIEKSAAKYFDTYRAAIVIVGDWSQVKDQVTPFGDVTVTKAKAEEKKE